MHCIKRLPVAIHERLVELFTFHHKFFVEFLNIQVRFGSSSESSSWFSATDVVSLGGSEVSEGCPEVSHAE